MKAVADIRDYLDLGGIDRDYISRAENFAEEFIAPHAAAWERQRQPGLPADVIAAWVSSGLMNTNVPTRYDGGGASFLAKIGIVEVLARYCLPSSFALCNLLNGPFRLSRDASPDQIARYLPALMAGESIIALALTEPRSGSDFASISCAARRVSGGWVLDGTKAWVTHATIADLCIVYAQTDPSLRAKGIASFIVNMRHNGCRVSAPYQLETGSVIGVADVILENCFVRETDVLQGPGEAFSRALASINAARTHVAAMCCGMAGAALGAAIDYARKRQSFGAAVTSHQGIRWKIADLASDLEASRLLTYRAAELVEQKRDAVSAAAIAKKQAVEMAQRCLPECLQIMGANGLRSEYAVSRHLLALRIAAFVDGTTEIQKDRIGRLVVGHG
jgi:alkylation response protein AidB-like acyl-CoA dehydrogenase